MRARALVVLLALALASLLALASPSYAPPPAVSTATPAAPGPSPFGPSPYPLPRGEKEPLRGRVVRTVDGDTIQVRLASGVEKVRYIGIDTPEVHHPTRGEEPGGRAATEVNRRLVGNRAVRLEPDVQARDRYGRLLAYAWYNGVSFNWLMIRQGWAVSYPYDSKTLWVDRFTAAEERARAEQLGLWRKNGFACRPADRRAGRC